MSLSDAVYDQNVFDGGPPLRLRRKRSYAMTAPFQVILESLIKIWF